MIQLPARSAPAPRPVDAKVSAWSLIKPYWVSDEWKSAWVTLAAILIMNGGSVWLSVRFNDWSGSFFNALQAKDASHFGHLMLIYALLLGSSTILFVYSRYLRQMLGFRWRQWLTRRYLDEWLGDRTFYRIERDHLADNPDQRISDDLRTFTETTLMLTIDLISTVATLASFVVILWTLSGAFTLHIGGTAFAIPGYMVWVAVAYAIAGSLVMHKFGHSLVSINYQQQRVEADFRFGLIRLRENAEQIAFYDGTEAEKQRALGVFSHIRENFWRIISYTKRLNFVLNFYSQMAEIFPLVVAAPQYFAGIYTFGALRQISGAFGNVSDSLSWFINSYGTLAEWRATVNRLREFHRVTGASHLKESLSPATEHGGIHLRYADSPILVTRGLQLALPDGAALTEIGNLTVNPGQRWLIRGASGAGKSTLLRSLAGLWPFGAGTIDAPVGAHMMFVPQQSYVPIGTLKAALTYPSAPDAFDDASCRDALQVCGLESYTERLSESAHWQRTLSPGEQQRLAGARVLLQQPDFLFLDECTSALDSEHEARLYRLFDTRLPQAAIVSVAHREAVATFHTHTLDVSRTVEMA